MMLRGKRRGLLGAAALGLFFTLAPHGAAETEVDAAAYAGQSTGSWACGPAGQARYGGIGGQVRYSERRATARSGRGGSIVVGAAAEYESVHLVPSIDESSPVSIETDRHPPKSIQGGLGFRGGNDWRYFGFQVGLLTYSAWDSNAAAKPSPYVLPQLELRAGTQDSLWCTAGFGSPLATTYRRPGAYLGLGLKRGEHELDATLGGFRAGASGFDDQSSRFDLVWKGLLWSHWGPRLGVSVSRAANQAAWDWEGSLGVAASL